MPTRFPARCVRAPGNGSGSAKLELVFPGGTYGIRKRLVSAEIIPVAEALPALLAIDPSHAGLPMRRSARVWAAAVAAGVGLVARGRLLPTVGADDMDVWRAGLSHTCTSKGCTATGSSPVNVCSSPPSDTQFFSSGSWEFTG